MRKLEENIGYIFENPSLLEEALTHSSYANEHGKTRVDCNERLEFLGDAVLSVVVAEHLFLVNPDVEEGELTKARSSMVCEGALAEFARDTGLRLNIELKPKVSASEEDEYQTNLITLDQVMEGISKASK